MTSMAGGDVHADPGPSEWERWRKELFGDPYLVWHDGPDFTALLEKARSDQHGVARMLAAGINTADSLAAASIAALAAARLAPDGSEALLRGALPGAQGTFLIRLAQALYTLTADPSWAGPIAEVMREAHHWGERMDAAIALAAFDPDPQLVAALARAVCDNEYLVRYHAARTLLRYAGHGRKLADLPELFAKIKTPASGRTRAADRAAWQEASDELRTAALRSMSAPDND
jgi:hypothetical protein